MTGRQIIDTQTCMPRPDKFDHCLYLNEGTTLAPCMSVGYRTRSYPRSLLESTDFGFNFQQRSSIGYNNNER